MKIPSLSDIRNLFAEPKTEQRGYENLTSSAIIGKDAQPSYQSEDADLWANRWALTAHVRDSFKTNPYYQAYRDTFWANVYGANGIVCQSTVKEEEDRIIHTPDEKAAIRAYERKRNDLLEWTAKKEGREFVPFKHTRALGDERLNGSRASQVLVGDPDIYARKLIEEAWDEWQNMDFCDFRGTRNYKTMRQIRGISAVRDGDFFIRMIGDPGVNKFGFTLQMINSEWCDHFYNETLPNGNVVRMGIEYQFNPSYGIGKVVAYHFIKRVPKDWQYSSGFMGRGTMQRGEHDRVPAEQIIHYARAVENEGTRPAPWVASTIPMARHLDMYQLSEVMAARINASRLGWFYSDIVPEGGFQGEPPDPSKIGPVKFEQGVGYQGLKYGVKVQESNASHPHTNYPDFRQEGVRVLCAGMPGADYSTMANDYAAINFAAGRLQRLDKQELYRLFQTFDIDYAERRIFEKFLYWSLATQAIKLPLIKFKKFKSAKFTGRAWKGVDELKESTASAMRVANLQSNDYIECAQVGLDFDEVAEGQAQANKIKEAYGLTVAKTVENPALIQEPIEEDEPEEKPAEKPETDSEGKSRFEIKVD